MHSSKYTPEFKTEIVKAYFNEEGGISSLAKKYHVSASSIKDWILRYREHGETAFKNTSSANSSYSSEFKYSCVQAVLSGESTVNEIIASRILNETP